MLWEADRRLGYKNNNKYSTEQYVSTSVGLYTIARRKIENIRRTNNYTYTYNKFKTLEDK